MSRLKLKEYLPEILYLGNPLDLGRNKSRIWFLKEENLWSDLGVDGEVYIQGRENYFSQICDSMYPDLCHGDFQASQNFL